MPSFADGISIARSDRLPAVAVASGLRSSSTPSWTPSSGETPPSSATALNVVQLEAGGEKVRSELL